MRWLTPSDIDPNQRRVKAKLRDDRKVASEPNETWAMDFVHDQLSTSRKLRILTIFDTFSRYSPVIDFMSLPDAREKREGYLTVETTGGVRPHSAIGNKPPITLINHIVESHRRHQPAHVTKPENYNHR